MVNQEPEHTKDRPKGWQQSKREDSGKTYETGGFYSINLYVMEMTMTKGRNVVWCIDTVNT
jgi:hypothetical protein